jgi:tetratricopeptide (TPR) repeat protein
MRWRAIFTEPANVILTLIGVVLAAYGTWWTMRHQGPRSLDVGLQSELSALLRPACADGAVQASEREAIDHFVATRAADVPAAEIGNLEKRICVASQSLARGSDFITAGRPSEALEEFRSAVQIDPESGAGWSNLGSAYLLLHQTRDARKAFEEALRLDPDSWLTRYNLACLYDQMGNDRPALDQFGQALRALSHEPDSQPVPALLRSVAANPSLAALRGDGCFQKLASKLKATAP